MNWPPIERRGITRAALLPALVVLLVGLVHGLIYVFLVPPWQHYDEPNHFEVAWLVAHRPGLPEPGDSDPNMNRLVVQSMAAHGFYGEPGSSSLPERIGGYPQFSDPKLYYLLASLPMRPLPEAEVDFQLYAGRLVSLALFLLTLLAAYGIASELAPPASPLRWLAPACLAMLPGFTDLMTSLNNDVGAIAAFSWYLWGCVRLLHRGFSLGDFLWSLAALVLCILTKRTVWIAVPLLPFALLFSLARGRLRRAAWALLIPIAMVGVIAVFSLTGLASWYTRPGSQARSTVPGRLSSSPLGLWAFKVQGSPNDPIPSPAQILPPAVVESLRGREVTLGAWMWALPESSATSRNDIQVRMPSLYLQPVGKDRSRTIALSQEPRFYTFTTSIPAQTSAGWIHLTPLYQESQADLVIYMDGLVLAEGEWPEDIPPVFSSPSCQDGFWGDRPFTNLLRNGCAEESWPQVRPWAERLGTALFPDYGYDRLSLALYTVLDLPGAGPYYREVGEILLKTFWAKFGWGHVPLQGRLSYWLLAVFTMLGVAGGFLAFGRVSRCPQLGGVVLFLGLASLILWGQTFIRGSNYIFASNRYYPPARYAYPAAIPTLLLFTAGWYELVSWMGRRISIPTWAKALPVLTLFLALDVWSVLSIWRFYYG